MLSCNWKQWAQAIPVGSTSLESFIASDVAISWLAGDMARMMQFGYKKIQADIYSHPLKSPKTEKTYMKLGRPAKPTSASSISTDSWPMNFKRCASKVVCFN